MTRRRALVSVALAMLISGCGGPPAAPSSPGGTLTLSRQTASVARNTTLALTATAQPAGGSAMDVTQQATWTSSNPAVATVVSGVVTVKDLGVADINVTFGGQSASARITGRRRMFFDGELTGRDASGTKSFVGIGIALDGQLLYDRGFSDTLHGVAAQVSITVRGDGPDKVISPGTHAVAVLAYLQSGTFTILGLPTHLTVSDADTGETLLTIPLDQVQATSAVEGINNIAKPTWTIDIPAFTQ